MENYHLYRLGIWLAESMPLGLAHFLASLGAEIAFILMWRRRRIVYANLRHVMPGIPWWARWSLARGAFRNFAYSIIDFMRIPRLTLAKASRYIAECHGMEHIEEARANGVGGVFASLHMGSWEVAGVYMGLSGVPITAAALPHKDPRIDEIFLGNRESAGIEIVAVGGALAKLEDAVARGRFVGLMVDLDTTGHGPVLPFFDQPTRVPNGHALLALRTGAWIIPCVTYRRLDGKLVIEVCEPIIPDLEHDTADTLTLRTLEVLERLIRARPDQWSMFHRLWPGS